MPEFLRTLSRNPQTAKEEQSTQALAKQSGDRRFAFDSYRRFVQMYSGAQDLGGLCGWLALRSGLSLEIFVHCQWQSCRFQICHDMWKVLLLAKRHSSADGRPNKDA